MLSNDDDGHKANDESTNTDDQHRVPNMTADLAPDTGSVWCGGTLGELSVPEDTIDERSLRVHHDTGGVVVDADFVGADASGGLFTVLSPEQARHMADALLRAADDHEQEWSDQ